MKIMKKLTVVTKRQADKMLVGSLFQPVNGSTLTKMRYDLGKYKNPARVGMECEVSDHTMALWSEKRKDSDGPYHALFCLVASH